MSKAATSPQTVPNLGQATNPAIHHQDQLMSEQSATTPPSTIFVGAIVRAVFGLSKAIATAAVRHRTYGALSSLDDHILKDIGISRSDIEGIAAQSPWPKI